MSTTRTTSHQGAVKGAVAAAAGVAVLLGGAGTFALWNASGAIGTTGTQAGSLTADFGTEVDWKDMTAGVEQVDVDPATFHMVPGDVLVGTTSVEVTAVGENLVVTPEITGADGNVRTFLDDDALTVTTGLVGSDGAPVTEIGAGTHTLTASVTIAYDPAGGNVGMGTDVDLNDIEFLLQQDTPRNVLP